MRGRRLLSAGPLIGAAEPGAACRSPSWHEAALSTVLRERTSDAHAQAERSPYMSALVGGRVDVRGLAALLGRLAPVYEALETVAARWAGDARVGHFVVPALHRSARLRSDLEHLTGCADVPSATAASVAYATRIQRVAAGSAPAFVAHHYTRYLGDLSGGQVLRAALARSLGLGDGSGASFFAFPGVRPGALAQEYRTWLDTADFLPAERQALVEEALVAYRLNADLAGELDADLPGWTTG